MDELEIPDFLDRRKRPDVVGTNAARPETRLDQTTQPCANGELGNDANSQKAILTGQGVAEKTLNEDTSLPHAICEPRQAECGEGSIRSEAAGVRTSTTVVPLPPLRRAAGTRFLPVPVAGGSIEVLRSFLNVQADDDFVLVVAWAMAVLRNRGPYPVLVVCGEQGSAKSNFTAIMRSLLDPNTAPLRTMPRDARDLFIAASNSHVLAFDNVSCVPNWISDTLVGSHLVVVSLRASSIPTRTRCCSTPPGR